MTIKNHAVTRHAGQLPAESIDREARRLRRLPKAVRDYLQYDCPSSIHLKNVEASVKARGADETLRRIKHKVALMTLEAYGPDHPNAQSLEGFI